MLYTILLLCLTTVIRTDVVSIEALIRCDPSISNWSAELLIYEDDWYRAGEHFITVNFTTTELAKVYMFDPFYPGCEFGREYEIGYQLKHNCTHTGQTLCIAPEPVDVSKYGEQEVNFYIKAYEMGTSECPPLSFKPE